VLDSISNKDLVSGQAAIRVDSGRNLGLSLGRKRGFGRGLSYVRA